MSVPVVGAACSVVSGAAGKVAGAGVGAVFSAAGNWVASGAVWLLQEVGSVMSTTTSVDLGAPWFAAHEAVMASLSAAVVLPMVCCAVIQAVYRQSASMLLRTFAVYLPLCLLFTGVAVELVRIALSVTDALSARVLSGAGVDTSNMFSGLSTFFAEAGTVNPAVPTFVVFVSALLVALAALILWLELAVRAAAVAAAVLFLPLALAALVWPAVSHWCRRLADTLAALVLSKLVIAAVLSLAASALAGGLGFSGAGSGGFSAVVTGVALLLVATVSPFTLLRLVPAAEAGATAHLESTRHRLQSAGRAPIRSGHNLALRLAGGDGASGEGGGAADVGTAGSGGGLSAFPMVAGAAAGPGGALAAGTASGAAGAAAGSGAVAGAAGAAGTGGMNTASGTAPAIGGGAPPKARRPGQSDAEVPDPAGDGGSGRDSATRFDAGRTRRSGEEGPDSFSGEPGAAGRPPPGRGASSDSGDEVWDA